MVEVTVENPYFPFCCERCRLIDLGNWAAGKYVVTSPVEPASEDDED
jgi:endogenous inhibitor of DNA gyrase (YacG/DUF329 family)